MGNDSDGRPTRTETKLVTIDSTLKDIREQLNGILKKFTIVEERLSNQDKKIEALEKVIQDYASMKKEIFLIKIENVELRKKVMNSEIMEENKLLRENIGNSWNSKNSKRGFEANGDKIRGRGKGRVEQGRDC